MPMECCYITGNQRCIGKLNERQTSEMIKFAVTLPNERWGAIEHGLDMLKWAFFQNVSAFQNSQEKIEHVGNESYFLGFGHSVASGMCAHH